MGKKTNERRKKFFEDLKKEGKLDKPLYVARVRPKPRPRVKVEPVPAAESSETLRFACCLLRYKDNLPNGFRMCRDCPALTSGP